MLYAELVGNEEGLSRIKLDDWLLFRHHNSCSPTTTFPESESDQEPSLISEQSTVCVTNVVTSLESRVNSSW